MAAMLVGIAVLTAAPRAQALPGPRMTAFNPAQHGFQFSNDFVSAPFQIPGLQDLRYGGLCGGMVSTALDHFNRPARMPRQNTLPATGTPLHQYIYQRQQTSLVDNADKWLELFFNPFGWNTAKYFHWGLQGFGGGRLEELRREIDSGRPAPLGLFKAGNGGTGPHHQVLAIGYDMGRYLGDLGAFKEDLKIFVYDPNFPNQTMTLRPNPQTTSYTYDGHPDKTWMTYFVDLRYRAVVPPVFPDPVDPAGGLVGHLRLDIATGGDDLRGGNDNVDVTVHFTNRPPQRFANINNRTRWIDWYTQTVWLALAVPVLIDDLDSVVLTTTFGSGLSPDNWNVNALTVSALGRQLFGATGNPLVRFTAENRPFVARLGNAVLDSGFEAQLSRAASAPWNVEGPDAKGIDVGIGLAHSGANNGWIRTSSRNWNSFTQVVPVTPDTHYTLRGFVRTSGRVNTAFFGVRAGTSAAPYAQLHFGPSPAGAYQRIDIPFYSGANTQMTVFVGFWGIGTDEWIQIDTVSIRRI